MKKCLAAIVLSCALFAIPIAVLAESTVDQICVGNPLTEGRTASYSETVHGQIFIPTLNHISKVAIFGNAIGSQTAKVKLKIQRASWEGPTYEKTIVLNNEPWWVEADFGEVPVTPGVQYLLIAQPLTTSISWYFSESANCNPSGYAFIGPNAQRDKDFYFSVRGYSETVQLENPVDPDSVEQSQDTPEPVSNTRSVQSSANEDTTANNTQPQDQTNQAPANNTDQNQTSSSEDKSFVSDKELTSANKAIANSAGNLTDEEMDQLLKMIADDYANSKKGMFGLSGVVGSVLTPPVFYTIVGIFVLLIILLILLIIKKRRASDE